MTVPCPSCGTGTVLATFQTELTLGAQAPTTAAPDTDGFIAAECTNDECRDMLAQDPGDGRLRNAGLQRDTDPDAWVDDPDLTAAWKNAVVKVMVIGCTHPDWAVTFNDDDDTMTCTVCGQTAPGGQDGGLTPCSSSR